MHLGKLATAKLALDKFAAFTFSGKSNYWCTISLRSGTVLDASTSQHMDCHITQQHQPTRHQNHWQRQAQPL
ncbi:hypothetical protein [Sporisorium scitamineum]|uniref:Uncharacterized protein n=1 Tax=Sporisorium scitamineum TaxID=49012 RepID=A0A0F7S5P0_9BASI|nr:hypothetical protein [Sporisorium scitamineum]